MSRYRPRDCIRYMYSVTYYIHIHNILTISRLLHPPSLNAYVANNGYQSTVSKSNSYSTIMIWTPYTSNTIIDTLDRLLHPPQLLTTRVSQQLCLLLDLVRLKVPYTYSLFSAVDVGSFDDWMSVRSWGDVDFDLGMRSCELWEMVENVGTGSNIRI